MFLRQIVILYCIIMCVFSNKLKTDPLLYLWGQSMWFGTKVNLNTVQQPIMKEKWIQKYMKFFTVPRWLAEQEFDNCDVNKDSQITDQQLRCY